MDADTAITLLLNLPYSGDMQTWTTEDLQTYVNVLKTIVQHAERDLRQR